MPSAVERTGRILFLRFHASGFESFRAFANYNYVTGAPFKILSASIIGAAMGLIGGLLGSVTRREEPLITNHEPRTANH